MRLDSRLRGNDAVWCDEEFFVAHEPLCFNVTTCTQTHQAHRRQRLAGVIPVWRAEHRRKSGGSPARLSGGAADAPFRGGPGFREAQGTTDAVGGGQAGVLGSPFFAYFLWRSNGK